MLEWLVQTGPQASYDISVQPHLPHLCAQIAQLGNFLDGHIPYPYPSPLTIYCLYAYSAYAYCLCDHLPVWLFIMYIERTEQGAKDPYGSFAHSLAG